MPPFAPIGPEAKAPHQRLEQCPIRLGFPAHIRAGRACKRIKAIIAGAKINRAILETLAFWARTRFWRGRRVVGRRRRRITRYDAKINRTAARVPRARSEIAKREKLRLVAPRKKFRFHAGVLRYLAPGKEVPDRAGWPITIPDDQRELAGGKFGVDLLQGARRPFGQHTLVGQITFDRSADKIVRTGVANVLSYSAIHLGEVDESPWKLCCGGCHAACDQTRPDHCGWFDKHDIPQTVRTAPATTHWIEIGGSPIPSHRDNRSGTMVRSRHLPSEFPGRRAGWCRRSKAQRSALIGC
jgi:hypothetical protein